VAAIVIGVIALGSVSAVEGVSVIAEAIVEIGAITINNPLAATTSIIAVKHPSKHNIYCVHYGKKIPGKSVLVTVHCI